MQPSESTNESQTCIVSMKRVLLTTPPTVTLPNLFHKESIPQQMLAYKARTLMAQSYQKGSSRQKKLPENFLILC